VGTTVQRILTIFNHGNSALTIRSITYPTGFSGDWAGSIPAGDSQNIPVTFTPGLVTSYGGNIAVNSDKTGGLETMPITGVGILAVTRILALSGDLTFGGVAVGSSAQRTLTIANTGDSTLTVSSIALPSVFSCNWGFGAIPPGDSLHVTITFSPVASTNYDGRLIVVSDKTSGENSRAISGSGTYLGRTPPIIGPIPDIVTSINVESELVSFPASDVETPSAFLLVQRISSTDPSVVPLSESAIQIQMRDNGTGAIIISPARDKVGESTITIRVIDDDGMWAERSFKFTVRSDARPSMRIERTGNTCVLSWPAGMGGYVTEFSEDLKTWSKEPQAPVVVGDQNILVPSELNDRKFYRLRRLP
jgi:hypothetical protein